MVTVAAAAIAGTAIMFATPPLLFAYPLPGLAICVATVAALGAGTVSVLFTLRHRRSRSSTDRGVAIVFGVIASLEASLPLVAELFPTTTTVAFWSRIIGRTVAAGGLVVIAWRRDRAVRRMSFAQSSVVVLGIAATVVGVTALRAAHLPAAIHGGTGSVDSLVRTPEVLGVRLAGTLALLGAAIGFARKSRATGDRTFELLACTAVLMATARFHDFLHPSLHADWMTTGDVVRVIASWLVVGGLARELHDAARGRQADAVESERRRVAAEIHDGIAQDLAFIRSQTSLIAAGTGDRAVVSNLQLAADHALDEARRVIVEYGQADRRPLGAALVEVARDVEARHSRPIDIDLDADSSRTIDAHTAHELQRAVGEALHNAARHAGGDRIGVSLAADPRSIKVIVSDDGRGLPGDATAADRFGLTSMRRRVEGLGGTVDIVSAKDVGTTVRIEVPLR